MAEVYAPQATMPRATVANPNTAVYTSLDGGALAPPVVKATAKAMRPHIERPHTVGPPRHKWSQWEDRPSSMSITKRDPTWCPTPKKEWNGEVRNAKLSCADIEGTSPSTAGGFARSLVSGHSKHLRPQTCNLLPANHPHADAQTASESKAGARRPNFAMSVAGIPNSTPFRHSMRSYGSCMNLSNYDIKGSSPRMFHGNDGSPMKTRSTFNMPDRVLPNKECTYSELRSFADNEKSDRFACTKITRSRGEPKWNRCLSMKQLPPVSPVYFKARVESKLSLMEGHRPVYQSRWDKLCGSSPRAKL